MDQLFVDSFFPIDSVKDIEKLDILLKLIDDDKEIIDTIYIQCSIYGFIESMKLIDKKYRIDYRIIQIVLKYCLLYDNLLVINYILENTSYLKMKN